MHGSTGVLSITSDAQMSHAVSSGGVGLIPTISCRSTVSDTEYENVSAELMLVHATPSVLDLECFSFQVDRCLVKQKKRLLNKKAIKHIIQ